MLKMEKAIVTASAISAQPRTENPYFPGDTCFEDKGHVLKPVGFFISLSMLGYPMLYIHLGGGRILRIQMQLVGSETHS